MKHPIRNSIIGLIVVLVLIGTSVCTYHIFFSSIEERADYISTKISKKLDLTALQNEKLSNLKVHLISVFKTLKQEKQQYHEEILALITNRHFDRTNASKLIQEKMLKINNESTPLIDLIAEFYDSLDKNQQQQIRAKIIKHNEKHQIESLAI